MSVLHAYNSRVFIGGVEVTQHVRAVHVIARVGELVRTEVEFLCAPKIDDGGFHLLPELQPQAQPGPMRAILIREGGE